MLASPTCPACGQRSWETVGECTFRREPPPQSDYLKLRYRVLFELWAPGQDEFRAQFVLCDECGFVGYTPRASVSEIDAKYRMIADEQRKDGSRAPVRRETTELDAERSRELYEALHPQLPTGGGRLLDFGGGNGGLMSHFAAAGFDCGVVDYTPTTVPGVTRLGDTLEDLPEDARFDVIFCSHVFEHLAEPVDVAEQLAGRLAPDGLLFIEVPLEILGGPPPMREPVTHVNFFCESSLSTALERAGLRVIDCHTKACLFASGAYRYGVRASARLSESAPGETPAPTLPGSKLARELLASGQLARATMAASHPRVLLNPVRNLRKRLGSS
jgi:SAM-dependent methyltransferase